MGDRRDAIGDSGRRLRCEIVQRIAEAADLSCRGTACRAHADDASVCRLQRWAQHAVPLHMRIPVSAETECPVEELQSSLSVCPHAPLSDSKAVACRLSPVASSLRLSWIEHVPQAVAEEVEAKDADHDRNAG